MRVLVVALLFISLLLVSTSNVDARRKPRPTPTPKPTPSIQVTPTPVPTLVPTSTPTPTTIYTLDEEFNSLTSAWLHNYSCCGNVTMDRSLSYVQDGILHQRAENRSGRWYTDIINSTYSQTYGYFEARIKIPKGKGLWPAFWLYKGTFGIDADEIDIMEICANPDGTNGGNDVSYLHQTVHKGTQSNQIWNPNGDMGGDLSLDWHVYGVDWRSTYIAFYIDGVETWRESSMLISSSKSILLNLGVGGSWCSSPDATTPSGVEMLVDWVRVRN